MTDQRNNDVHDPHDETAAAALDAPAGEDTATDPRVERLEQERDELKDLLLRKTAEFDNYRKRTDRERLTLTDAITAGVVEDLLPLVDDLERAIRAEAEAGGAEAYRRGVELILKQLEEVLRKRGVTAIEALGTSFDPHYHEAVTYEAAEGRREGEILDELRRGYRIGDRLLRPSMVKVAKG